MFCIKTRCTLHKNSPDVTRTQLIVTTNYKVVYLFISLFIYLFIYIMFRTRTYLNPCA